MDMWPDWAKRTMMLWHKNDSQMYNLMYFLIGNGVPPWRARRWTLGGHMEVKDGIWTLRLGQQYTPKEVADADKVAQKAVDGELLRGNKMVYDVILGRPVKM